MFYFEDRGIFLLLLKCFKGFQTKAACLGYCSVLTDNIFFIFTLTVFWVLVSSDFLKMSLLKNRWRYF